MRRIGMPSEARKIIDALYSAGYEAYIVGGCVRDELLGREPEDYDITTSAPPEEIKRLFEKTVDTGIEHGTVTVIENGKPYEVTTFRMDGEYKDNRHPVSISYTGNVKEDLARRDFTVNALAYNDKEGIIDAFSGIDDLEKGVIRCVREPSERFSEDALRVLRGIRFSSVLGFDIEENTAKAIKKYAKNLNDISAERIYTEWKKLLSGKGAYDVVLEFKEVIEVFIPELKGKEVPPRAAFSGLTWDERQILLFASCENSGHFQSFAKRIKMDTKTRDMAVSVLNNVAELAEEKKTDLRRFVIGKSDELSEKCAKVAAALGICSESTVSKTKELITKDAPRKLSQLAINGNDLIKLGIKGEKIGKLLDKILFMVATEQVQNTKEKLVDYIVKNNL